MDHEARNGTGSDDNEEYTNIYFIVGDRRETATYKANQVTDMELKGERELLLPHRAAETFIGRIPRAPSARTLFYLFNVARVFSKYVRGLRAFREYASYAKVIKSRFCKDIKYRPWKISPWTVTSVLTSVNISLKQNDVVKPYYRVHRLNPLFASD